MCGTSSRASTTRGQSRCCSSSTRSINRETGKSLLHLSLSSLNSFRFISRFSQILLISPYSYIFLAKNFRSRVFSPSWCRTTSYSGRFRSTTTHQPINLSWTSMTGRSSACHTSAMSLPKAPRISLVASSWSTRNKCTKDGRSGTEALSMTGSISLTVSPRLSYLLAAASSAHLLMWSTPWLTFLGGPSTQRGASGISPLRNTMTRTSWRRGRWSNSPKKPTTSSHSRSKAFLIRQKITESS